MDAETYYYDEDRDFDLHGLGAGFRSIAGFFFFTGVAIGGVFDLTCFLIKLLRARIQRAKHLDKHKDSRDFSKPAPVNPAPTVAEILAQWERVHDSLDEVVKFGGMLLDLEAVVDNSHIFDTDPRSKTYGSIIGRNPGVKGFLSQYCPSIGYKTAMRYRALAKKIRKLQTTGKAVMNPQNISRNLKSAKNEISTLKIEKNAANKVSGTKFADAVPEDCAKCRRIATLGEAVNEKLGVKHYKLEQKRKTPRRKCSKLRLGDKPMVALQPALRAIRSRTREIYAKLAPAQRTRYVAALQSLAAELAGG